MTSNDADAQRKLFFKAVIQDDKDTVELLIADGVDWASVRNQAGETPLEVAKQRKRTKVLQYLRKLNAEALNKPPAAATAAPAKQPPAPPEPPPASSSNPAESEKLRKAPPPPPAPAPAASSPSDESAQPPPPPPPPAKAPASLPEEDKQEAKPQQDRLEQEAAELEKEPASQQHEDSDKKQQEEGEHPQEQQQEKEQRQPQEEEEDQQQQQEQEQEQPSADQEDEAKDAAEPHQAVLEEQSSVTQPDEQPEAADNTDEGDHDTDAAAVNGSDAKETPNLNGTVVEDSDAAGQQTADNLLNEFLMLKKRHAELEKERQKVLQEKREQKEAAKAEAKKEAAASSKKMGFMSTMKKKAEGMASSKAGKKDPDADETAQLKTELEDLKGKIKSTQKETEKLKRDITDSEKEVAKPPLTSHCFHCLLDPPSARDVRSQLSEVEAAATAHIPDSVMAYVAKLVVTMAMEHGEESEEAKPEKQMPEHERTLLQAQIDSQKQQLNRLWDQFHSTQENIARLRTEVKEQVESKEGKEPESQKLAREKVKEAEARVNDLKGKLQTNEQAMKAVEDLRQQLRTTRELLKERHVVLAELQKTQPARDDAYNLLREQAAMCQEDLCSRELEQMDWQVPEPKQAEASSRQSSKERHASKERASVSIAAKSNVEEALICSFFENVPDAPAIVAHEEVTPTIEFAEVATQVELARNANESTSTLDTRMEDIRIEMALMRKRTARELQDLKHLLREQEAELRERGVEDPADWELDNLMAAEEERQRAEQEAALQRQREEEEEAERRRLEEEQEAEAKAKAEAEAQETRLREAPPNGADGSTSATLRRHSSPPEFCSQVSEGESDPRGKAQQEEGEENEDKEEEEEEEEEKPLRRAASLPASGTLPNPSADHRDVGETSLQVAADKGDAGTGPGDVVEAPPPPPPPVPEESADGSEEDAEPYPAGLLYVQRVEELEDRSEVLKEELKRMHDIEQSLRVEGREKRDLIAHLLEKVKSSDLDMANPSKKKKLTEQDLEDLGNIIEDTLQDNMRLRDEVQRKTKEYRQCIGEAALARPVRTAVAAKPPAPAGAASPPPPPSRVDASSPAPPPPPPPP